MRILPYLRIAALALAIAIVTAQAWIWLRPPTSVPATVTSGVAAVGAPFTLTDQHGRLVSDVDLRGKIVVLTFGWTRDPDVTPALLQLLDAAFERLGPKNKAFVPVFVTVDPERDGATELHSFSMHYHSRLRVLGGSPEAITRLTSAFRLPVTRVTDNMLPSGYSIDLPAVYYVLGADGRFRGVVSYTTDSASLAADFAKLGAD